MINKLDRAVTAIAEGKTPTAKTAKVLLRIFDNPTELIGQPVHDWQIPRNQLAGSVELDEVFEQARLLRLLHATDTLAWALLDAWDGTTSYRNAARVALADAVVNAARVALPS
ncbi:hypothetical protein [Nocardia cyriacigeorgica]|uniref:hypothetical protein n=1 Tax=Nocardia cyriacigeorgica TaxID=135487 RepID=UPI002457CC0E|nr:hypothetical protein [Nocardia cyriacigeorgica]